MENDKKAEIEATLARARKTVADSRELIAQVHLRVQETDRFLAKQGLTREQVQGMRFTKEQRLLANEHLKRLGLPPLEDLDFDFDRATAELREAAGNASGSKDVVEDRRQKLGAFMRGVRL